MSVGDSGSDDVLIAAAVAVERTRLAEALHDGAMQDLAVAQQNWLEARDGDDEAFGALHDDLARLGGRLRELTGGMHEETLDEVPLHRAMERALDGLQLPPRLEVVLEIDPRAGGDHGPFLRQTVRELVANVARHANATRVEVSVVVADVVVVLRVSDDGGGFDPQHGASAGTAGHLGLARVRRTAAKLGGTFAIAAAPPGTVATMTLPVSLPGAPAPDAP